MCHCLCLLVCLLRGRRLPLFPSQRWAAGIAFKHDGRTWISVHYASPFGAVSSTHNWERVGDLICLIAKKMLGLPVHRYVDDFFACDRFGHCCRMLAGVGACMSGALAGRSVRSME